VVNGDARTNTAEKRGDGKIRLAAKFLHHGSFVVAESKVDFLCQFGNQFRHIVAFAMEFQNTHEIQKDLFLEPLGKLFPQCAIREFPAALPYQLGR
jgi:hypothetical protein